MISDLLSQLKSWTEKIEQAKAWDPKDFYQQQRLNDFTNQIRVILGEIMASVNEASSIFKTASRTPSPENSVAVRGILDEVENYPSIKLLLAEVKKAFSEPGGLQKSKQARTILHTVHYLERASFTREQVEKLREMARVSHASDSDFPEEINQAGLANLFRNSIYNLSGGTAKSLKVIRELLQNAVDATDPKLHPELLSRADFAPEIHIEKETFYKEMGGDKRQYFMDLIIEDKGVGMDWETLSRKFFVTFDSGKSKDKGAAGGFGIAKQLIQDAPDHGWSVDTRGLHSSRFNKNLFFGTRKGEDYTTPSSEIRRTADGTTISLHGLPYAGDEDIKKLCSVYGTNGRIKIFFNGEEQKPKFTMESADLKPISSSESITDAMADSGADKDAAGRILSKFKGEMDEKIEEIGLSSTGKTSYKFYLKKNESGSGKLYVMVNGQYQFDKDEYIPKVDIVCAVETTARPGEEDYPLDPGREYLRGDITKKISELIGIIREFSRNVAEDDLFKDGIEMINVNEEAEPMVIDDTDSTTSKEDMITHVLQGITGAATFGKSEEPKSDDRGQTSEPENRPNEPENRTSEPQGNSEDRPYSPPDTTSSKDSDAPETAVDKVTNDLFKIAGSNSMFSKEAIRDMVEDAMDSKDPVEKNEKIRAIIDGLSTPAQILIQKNFVAKPAIQDNPRILSDIMIIWQKAMRLIIQKISATTRYSFTRGKEFVPGVIFSDECLGLYVPANKDSGRKHASVSINPVTLAAFILPKDFMDRVSDEGREKEAFELLSDSEKPSVTDTPINRVAKFIFHLAVHEMCHLIYPDGRHSGAENFHRNITKMELICHDVYEEIRQEVKKRMPQLRKSAKRLITLVAKHKASQVKEWALGFREWSQRKVSVSRRELPKLSLESSKTKAETFRQFLNMPD